MRLGTPTPILRILDETKAREFYLQISKAYKNARSELQKMPWGNDMSITDPFGNRLIFTDVATAT